MRKEVYRHSIFCILLMTLCAFPSLAQEKKQVMKVWRNGTATTFYIHETDSVTFSEEVELNTEPSSSMTEESIYQDASVVKQVMASAYQTMATFMSAELRMEQMALAPQWERISAGSSTINTAWTYGYQVVTRCNMLYQAADQVQGLTESEKNYYRNQAVCLRSVAYYIMTKLWGDIPYLTKVITDADEAVNVTQESSEVIVLDCIRCIEQGIDSLPVDNEYMLSSKNLRLCLQEMYCSVKKEYFTDYISPFYLYLSQTRADGEIGIDGGYISMWDATSYELLSQEQAGADAQELAQRWKELLDANHYGIWNALVRLDKAPIENGMQPCLLFPIPQQMLKMTPNMKQNDGY